jgi:hypothetical protein
MEKSNDRKFLKNLITHKRRKYASFFCEKMLFEHTYKPQETKGGELNREK